MPHSMIDIEIQRIINLKERQMKSFEERSTIGQMLMLLKPNDEYLKEKFNLGNEYYKNAIIYLDKKIEFFNYFKNKGFPKNFINTMNETMNDWLLSGWAYFGMEEHNKQAKDAKDEFEFYKAIISRSGVIQDKKKPTRRGGKKHRKS